MDASASNGCGYAAEMRQLDEEIGAIGADVWYHPVDPVEITKYVYRRYQRAAIARDLRDLLEVEPLIDRAIGLLVNPADLYVLKANLALKLHRLVDARAALAAHPLADQSREARLIRADCDFQQGRYEAAKRGYSEALDREVTWDALARLAHFHAEMGDVAEAETLYTQAEAELTAKEMRSFAWLRVQQGQLHFRRGRFAEARAHYSVAEAAYPSNPLVEERVAEVLAAEGFLAEAAARFEKIAASRSRPELDQARGELYEIISEPEKAAACHRRALDAYLDSANHGEVHYYHHLADYYCDVAQSGAEAVKWALRDLELRENFSTQSALAFAYYRDGKLSEAMMWINRALSSGAVGASLFHKAATIFLAAGNEELGKSYMERARELNPHLGTFHAHL
jgi:tetratricopeptide (TPR) repeat protein